MWLIEIARRKNGVWNRGALLQEVGHVAGAFDLLNHAPCQSSRAQEAALNCAQGAICQAAAQGVLDDGLTRQ